MTLTYKIFQILGAKANVLKVIFRGPLFTENGSETNVVFEALEVRTRMGMYTPLRTMGC